GRSTKPPTGGQIRSLGRGVASAPPTPPTSLLHRRPRRIRHTPPIASHSWHLGRRGAAEFRKTKLCATNTKCGCKDGVGSAEPRRLRFCGFSLFAFRFSLFARRRAFSSSLRQAFKNHSRALYPSAPHLC